MWRTINDSLENIYTRDPKIDRAEEIVNTSVEVGIKSLSFGAQIAAAAGIVEMAGTFITPGIGTAAGAAIAVAAVIITAAVSWLIDWGVDAITHDIKWGEEENSFADISKDYMYDLYVAYNEWYEEKEKTGEVFSMGGK